MDTKQQIRDSLISQFVKPGIIKSKDKLLAKDDADTIIPAANDIAALFGNKKEFSAIITADQPESKALETKLINSFFNNLTLLVQKTWVEKSDEALKEQVFAMLETMCKEIQKNAYASSYKTFITILHDAVYLMFGSQTKKEDFDEYALRIDPGFGIFWWYLESLPSENNWSNEKARIVMLPGIFFLANY